MKKKSIIKLAALCMSSVLLFAGCGKKLAVKGKRQQDRKSR